jgi:hypothetical protein
MTKERIQQNLTQQQEFCIRNGLGLTNEDFYKKDDKLDPTAGWTYDRFARAIEAKLKEKNT